jgi:hypothetical protein
LLRQPLLLLLLLLRLSRGPLLPPWLLGMLLLLCLWRCVQ